MFELDRVELAFDVVFELDRVGLRKLDLLLTEHAKGPAEALLEVVLGVLGRGLPSRHREGGIVLLLVAGRRGALDLEAEDAERGEHALAVVLELGDLGCLAGLGRRLAPIAFARELDLEPVHGIDVVALARLGRSGRQQEQTQGGDEEDGARGGDERASHEDPLGLWTSTESAGSSADLTPRRGPG